MALTANDFGDSRTYILADFTSGGTFVGDVRKVADAIENDHYYNEWPFERLYVVGPGSVPAECQTKRDGSDPDVDEDGRVYVRMQILLASDPSVVLDTFTLTLDGRA